MSVEASLLTDADAWNDLVERSAATTPFHRYEALEVIADHSGTTLHPYAAYDGEAPVGLFPVFSRQRWPLRTVFSPPPDLDVSYLGPATLDGASPTQRAAERRHRRFVESVFERVDEAVEPHYAHVRSSTGYDDPRPFVWNGFEPTPRYTYEVDVTPDEDELFTSFSSEVRENVRTAEEFDYALEEGGAADVERVVRRVQARHEEQDVSPGVTRGFARDLYRSLPDGTVRAYTVERDGRFVGGKLTLEDDETLYGWQTVADREDDLPAVDRLEWEVMKRARERGLERVDLVGADDRRRCADKAKFDPEVRIHYSLERSSPTTDTLQALYDHLR